ncbi:MAG TPA: tRNA nucleotidyltransferase, partial [Planctomycetaceae bacterium]|nr:tRNA nucleotidyltransferase [Planctomycetaceae bacterium]
MPARCADPAAARDFALAVVGGLRRAGHEAYWAGGCVRDELLGRTPADYDVATAARPEQVREIFGRRRTLAVGAAFGVITVLGPRTAGQVEVATFRADAPSTDGRHPDGVTFCSAREDARRRDFTINGLFLDPLTGEVHDFVGGRDDLDAGIVRAIGMPAQRFAEDHLRMLR